jgi:APA family basic amino acid/polyamine antiporter
MGAMTLCGALCYGELAARYPEAGGGYVYLREAFGRPTAFLYGWVSMVVIDPGITAALAEGVSKYSAALVPLFPGGRKAVAVGTVLALAAVNALGVRLGAGVLRGLTLAKLGLLAFIAAWGFGSGLGSWDNLSPLAEPRSGWAALPAALALAASSAFFSFGGWWDVSKVAGEVRDPGRTMPRALTLGVLVVTAVFVLVTALIRYLVPPDLTGDKDSLGRFVGETLFGPSGGKVYAALVVLVVAGSLCSILMSQPRLYFAMARDGLFLPALARVHPQLGTPVRAIVLEAVLASLVVLWGGEFESILGLFLFTAVLLVAMSVAALFVLRRRPPPVEGIPSSGYPVTAVVYLAMSGVLLGLMGYGDPKGAAIGVAAAALGLLAYRLLPGSAAGRGL